MATIASDKPGRVKPITPDLYERILAWGAIALLVAVLTALARGHAEWGRVPAVIWPHLLTILVALVLTPVMLLRPRGDRMHRVLGTIWIAAMFATALLSFRVQTIRPGHFGPIHLLSAFVTVMAPYAWWLARTHRIAQHRRVIRGLVTGALLIAGFFTFPFNRLLGHWLFG